MAKPPSLPLAAFCAALTLAHPAAAVEVAGPYIHHNLAVYLVHGPDGPAGALDTLEQALERGQVVVYETGSVNQLAIENRSADRAVFVQAGDIVKGGRQDRVFSQDLVLEPKSGRVPIDAPYPDAPICAGYPCGTDCCDPRDFEVCCEAAGLEPYCAGMCL